MSDAQDPFGWEALEQEESPWLTRLLRRRLPSDAVDDVLQETWLAFLRLGPRYEESGRRRALLQRIAVRRATDWHRAHPVQDLPRGPEAAENPDPDFTPHLLRTADIKPGSLLWRRVVDDWSLSMLAAHFGVPVGTVKSRLAAERRDLVRRLGDWRQSLAGPEEPCHHVRADVLGVSACPRCAQTRAAWRALVTRASSYAGFQTTYFTVGSDGGLWLDAILDLRQAVLGGEPIWGNSPATMGPFRRLQNAYGQNLSSRVRPGTDGAHALLLFPIRPEDGRRFTMTQHGTPSQAEASATIRASRHQVEIHLNIGFAAEANGTTLLELPPALAVVQADPAPTHMASPHDRMVMVWANAADLGHYPVVVTRMA